jgi:hypothetical protein
VANAVYPVRHRFRQEVTMGLSRIIDIAKGWSVTQDVHDLGEIKTEQ